MVQCCDWINPASGRVIPDGGDEDDDVAEVKVANDTRAGLPPWRWGFLGKKVV